jgi:hypothetical protein
MTPRAIGFACAAALVMGGCKTEDRIHVDCGRVCAHFVEVRTSDCIYNCGDSRAAAKEGCVKGDCPLWTPVQADCMMSAQSVAAMSLCAYQR